MQQVSPKEIRPLTTMLIAVAQQGFNEGSFRVGVTALSLGAAYKILGESLNTVVHRSWTYVEWMPTLPLFGTGLAPLMQ
jgi:hypothetical protein